MARYPNRAMDVGSRGPPCRNQRFDVFGIYCKSCKSTVRSDESCEPIICCCLAAAAMFGQGQRWRHTVAAVEKHLDARGAVGCRLTKGPAILLPESRQHALDMLARSKPIRAMIDAAAGIREAIEIPDFHVIEAAAAGAHPERAENRLVRFQRLDADDFGSTAPAAERNLVLIGCSPALQGRRPVKDDCGFAFGASAFHGCNPSDGVPDRIRVPDRDRQ